jgi:ribonucleotide reductase alpha subunit
MATKHNFIINSEWVKFQDVKDMSPEEYFKGNSLSINSFKNKYLIPELNEKNPAEVMWRVASYIATPEKDNSLEAYEYWRCRWFHEMFTGWWMAAGSIMQGAANPKKVSMSNCTTIGFGIDGKNGDNLESIFDTAYTVAKVAAFRQGLGVHFDLRPQGMPVHNSSKESLGNTHWMKYINEIGNYIGQKGRIPAMLFSINCKNPDFPNFITIKSDQTTIANANISVHFTNEFMEILDKVVQKKLPEDTKWVMEYRTDSGDVLKTEKPILELFNSFVKNNWAFAEPGAQFVDIAKEYSNSDYLGDERFKIKSTNACVSGDTYVLTKNGYVQIRNLIDTPIDIWNGKDWSVVTPRITGENKQMFKVTLSDYTELVCTDNHTWLINTGNKYSPKETRIETQSLKHGDKLFKYQMPVVDYQINQAFSHAYTHGFYCGDGMTGRKGEKSALLYGEKQALSSRLVGTISNFEPDAYDRIYIRFPDDLSVKYNVPINSSIFDRLEWLAGLIDSDGTSTSNKNSTGIQIANTNLDFLKDVRLMLTTLGVQAKIQLMHEPRRVLMPDGNGGQKEYDCQAVYRVLIGGKDVAGLVALGLKPSRVELLLNNPNRNASKFVTVVGIEKLGVEEKVYCFTEEKNHTGTFNGIVTGQCSEQYLEYAGKDVSAGLCVLSSTNFYRLPKDIKEAKKVLRYDIAPSITRFLDNTVEMEIRDKRYPIKGQLNSLKALRRIGAGVTNLDGWLIRNGIGYDTKEGIAAITGLVDEFNAGLYETSIALGAEKGNFGLFSEKNFMKSPFVSQMAERHSLKFKTMRNVCVGSIAPTGTLSSMFNTIYTELISYGFEPIMAYYWWKRERTSGKYVWTFNVPRIVRDILMEKGVDIGMTSDSIIENEQGNLGESIAKIIDLNFPKDRFKPAHEINPFRKVELMGNLTRQSVDSSISITYNLPEDVSEETVRDVYIYAWKNKVKSIAIYRDKSRVGIVEFVPPRVAEQRFSSVIPVKEAAAISKSVKRPDVLNCDVHHISVKGEKWIAFVGTVENKPYEIFAGKQESISLPKKYNNGVLLKDKKSKAYIFESGIDDDLIRVNVTKSFTNDEHSALTRQISLSMRHGVPLKYVIDQLDKSHGTIVEFSKTITRVLKNYLTEEDVSGMKCKECGGNNLIWAEKCPKCLDCGSSSCG